LITVAAFSVLHIEILLWFRSKVVWTIGTQSYFALCSS
jgi:hypothetical protein